MIFDQSQAAAGASRGGESNKETHVPVVDLSSPNCKTRLVKAFQELGFCKVINHGVPSELITEMEDQALNFFNLPLDQKHMIPGSPFGGYGDKLIGKNGDVGWLEYLLFSASIPQVISNLIGPSFSCAVNKYVEATKNMACRVLEVLADGLQMDENDTFSRMLKDDKNDSYIRINHYPLVPQGGGGKMMMGFGEHTDPQIISVLRSNDACGFEISDGHGNWLPVPPDPNSFFLIVGDSLQVMSNGRFKSVRHRVVAQGKRPRISMIYFGSPALCQKIAPLRTLMRQGEEKVYKEFTWQEYKMAAYSTRLADYRLARFEVTTTIPSTIINPLESV